jgi:hypothetical protein
MEIIFWMFLYYLLQRKFILNHFSSLWDGGLNGSLYAAKSRKAALLNSRESGARMMVLSLCNF